MAEDDSSLKQKRLCGYREEVARAVAAERLASEDEAKSGCACRNKRRLRLLASFWEDVAILQATCCHTSGNVWYHSENVAPVVDMWPVEYCTSDAAVVQLVNACCRPQYGRVVSLSGGATMASSRRRYASKTWPLDIRLEQNMAQK